MASCWDDVGVETERTGGIQVDIVVELGRGRVVCREVYGKTYSTNCTWRETYSFEVEGSRQR